MKNAYLKTALTTLLFLFLSSHVFSQTATATWALTAGNTSAAVGNITANNFIYTNVNFLGYNATWGIQADNFGGIYCVPTYTSYYEFNLAPSGCNDLVISSITFTHRLSFPNRCYQLRYSIDGGAEVQISEIRIAQSNVSQPYSSGALSISVPMGSTIRLRLYAAGSVWTDFGCRNFVVNGTTTPVVVTPSVSVAAAPGTTICPNTSVTFTATPTNGGGTPSYQWKLNGVNVGTNSSTYVNATLSDADQVSCVLTSSDPCASPTTASSNTITMSVITTPATPGAITGATTLLPATSGQIYSIAAVTNATSYTWSVPIGWTINSGNGTTSISVTTGAAGQDGNISVTASNSCGTSAASTLPVIVQGNPTITLGANPSVCRGTTSANLTYSATTYSPNQYSINYDITAEAQGFVDVVLAALPTTPIVLTVPGAAAAGTYNANLTVTNSGSGFSSVNYPITVTVITIPSTVTVSGGGTFCGSTTLTTSGGTGGTIYWQNTTSNGISTTTPSVSEVVNTSGTYYFRAENNGCWGTEGSTTTIINPLPTITLNANTGVCQGITSANITYSATSSSPSQYSINYDITAEAQGFVDVTLSSLPASPIALTVPAGAATGTYNANLIVKNTITGCVSNSYPITVSISTAPSAVIVSGGGTFCGSAVITASGGAGGTIYWQNTTSNGTSTTTPSASEVVNTSGTYYFRSGSSGCWGTEGNTSVTITPLPGITLGANPSVCQGSSSVNLTYSGTINSPSQYSIDYDLTAEAQGFVDVTLSSLPASPIVLTVPTGAATGTYNANLTVKNTSTGCVSNNYAIQVSVIITPAIPGSIAGSAAVIPNTSGLVYSISAVPDADNYTWAVPAGWTINAGNGTTSITVTSGNLGNNGDISVTASNLCGISTASTLAVVVGIPTITLGSNPTVCQGTTSANLTYSATTENPDQYSIDYNVTAEVQGFLDVTLATLPISPVVLSVPGTAIPGTYYANLTVRNSITGINSDNYPIAITITTTPATPGPISGATNALPNTADYTYRIALVKYATTYTWTVPPNWTITGGSGTHNITVTTGNSGDNGNVTVTASNFCNTSTASVLAVTSVVPIDHNAFECDACHVFHDAPGAQLSTATGNHLICVSCHIAPSGYASSQPFPNAIKATPGIGGVSHSWDVSAVNLALETNTPTTPAMASRIINGNIVCSTCHDQHDNTFVPYLRVSNAGDAMCKDCHSSRDLQLYASDNINNKGSHPVGIVYNSADSRFNAAPVATQLPGGKVECSSCHGVHDVQTPSTQNLTTDGYLLRASNDASLCTDCHVYKGVGTDLDHKGMTCLDCHTTHDSNLNNILLISSTINTPNSGAKPVVFTANTTASNYADASGTYDGICEVCHTQTEHYTNTSGGTADARHVPASQKCTDCHPHNRAFYAQANCFDCHNAVADKPGVGPPGGRRQVVDNNGNGSGTGGDFKRSSHHVNGAIPTISDCVLCHYMGDHRKGSVKLIDPDQGYLTIYTYDPLNKSSIENFCLNCHDGDGVGGDTTPFSDGITVPTVDQTTWSQSSHKSSAYTCLDCHDNGHGSNKNKLLEPYNYTADGSADPMNDEEEFCENCHSAAGAATSNIESEFNLTHTHQVDEVSQQGNISGLECVSCHNPHQNTSTYPNSDPDNTNILWTQATNGTRDFCLRCHDGAPPTGITFPATSYGTGWDKSNYVNSRHDAVINTGETNFVGTKEDCLACHSHHGTSGTAENSLTGIYTMINGKYDKSGNSGSNACNTWDNNVNGDYQLCWDCHNTTLITNRNDAFEKFHDKHVRSMQSPCILCHDVHNSFDATESGLINFDTYGLTTKSNSDVIPFGARNASSMYVPGACYLTCHATWCGSKTHKPKSYAPNPLAFPWSYTWPK